MSWSLDGGTAIVTGASSGIGAAMVHELVKAGMRVVATARRVERLQALADSLGPDRVAAIAADLVVPEDRERLVAETQNRFGPVTLLVNNAGMGQRGPVELVSAADAQRQMDVNVFSQIELTRLVLPGMRKAGRGRVMMVSSIMGRVTVPLSGWYCASKHALEALSDALRYELAPFGVDVLLIEPGPIITEFEQEAVKTLEKLEGDVSAYRRLIDTVYARRKKTMRGWISATECARIMTHAAAAEHPKARYPITRLTHALLLARWVLPSSLFDTLIRRSLHVPRYGELRSS
jgi:short-subunit dehydrogenase